MTPRRDRPLPPGVLISIALEQPVRVVYDAMSEGQLARLNAWIRSRPELHELVTRAAAIADQDAQGAA